MFDSNDRCGPPWANSCIVGLGSCFSDIVYKVKVSLDIYLKQAQKKQITHGEESCQIRSAGPKQCDVSRIALLRKAVP